MVGGRPLTGPGPPPPAAGGWRGPGGGEASPQPPSACASVHVPLLTRTRAHGRGPRGPHSNLTSRATSVQIRSPLRCWGWDAHTNGGHTPSPPRSSLQDLPVARPPCDSRGHAGGGAREPGTGRRQRRAARVHLPGSLALEARPGRGGPQCGHAVALQDRTADTQGRYPPPTRGRPQGSVDARLGQPGALSPAGRAPRLSVAHPTLEARPLPPQAAQGAGPNPRPLPRDRAPSTPAPG